jgi:hypothetical protein
LNEQRLDETGEGTTVTLISLPDGARLRRVRVVHDYGMFDRREAPQYYPDVEGAITSFD